MTSDKCLVLIDNDHVIDGLHDHWQWMFNQAWLLCMNDRARANLHEQLMVI